MTGTGSPAASGDAASRTKPYEDVSDLLSQYLERATSDGSAALQELCDRHPAQADELRRRVRRLQQLGLAGGSRERTESIGPFRVLGVLGQGGMGRVYLGQQTEPVRRLAAIKIMHPDRDASRLVQRFEAERQALAVLDHPGIAHVLEAGSTPAGEPWFAMEFVDGKPITTACDEARLPVSERIGLFLQVCDAVTHAHQNGILHRDLKPNNVLVTERDGVHVVKVIDFGLVKLLGPGQEPLEGLTLDGQVLGTPAYMSPEQAGALDRPVDLRTDVYALGVILHELLVGRRPLQAADKSGMAEMLRQLREVDPPPPSRAVLDLPPELAAARGLDAARWSRALAGDLDWIVGKALAREPAERYASVSELAADLRRHLQDEPVLAGPPSTIYRLERFVRRHRREVAVGALGLLGLVVALVYISLQAVRLSRELDSFDVLAREIQVANLVRRADQELWPATPERLPDLQAWQREVQSVDADVPTFERLLEVVRGRGRTADDGSTAFDSPRDGYLHDHIVALLASVAALHAPKGPVEAVDQRVSWARGLHELTIVGPADRWREAIESIADPRECPAYGGLRIEPQLGLVPLGRDPASGLWEFAFPQPGEQLPARVDGRWTIANDTCLVLVLIPGGSFQQGAEGFHAVEAGGKVVSLDPYFISRYEMTQGQWERIDGRNPSRYTSRTAAHPVEQISWLDAQRVVARIGLQLPTGAQWEYAARAGAPSPWWTGPADVPPPGSGNFADASLLASMGRDGGIPRFDEAYDDGWKAHAPVDSFLPNPFGLHNVMGNVWEWCQDCAYGLAEAVPRPGDGLREPLVPDPDMQRRRELRGGSYYSTYDLSRSTYFNQQPAESANIVYGLRPARALVRAAGDAPR